MTANRHAWPETAHIQQAGEAFRIHWHTQPPDGLAGGRTPANVDSPQESPPHPLTELLGPHMGDNEPGKWHPRAVWLTGGALLFGLGAAVGAVIW